MSYASLEMTHIPHNIRGQGHATLFCKILPLNHIFGVGERRHFKYRALVDTEVY